MLILGRTVIKTRTVPTIIVIISWLIAGFSYAEDNVIPPEACVAKMLERMPNSREEAILKDVKVKSSSQEEQLHRFKLGDTLSIRVVDGCFDSVTQEIRKSGGVNNLKLLLDGVPMEGLIPSISTDSSNRTLDNGSIITVNGLIISFHLYRNSEIAGNLAAWTAFLDRQNQGYEMAPTVSLAIGTDLPRNLSASQPFKLYIASSCYVFSASAIGISFVGIAFWLLKKDKCALRDSENGPYSLGRSQMAFWGLLVIAAFAAIMFVTGSAERIPPKVLMLLGISGATGLASVLIGGGKKVAADSTREEKLAALRREQAEIEQAQLALVAGATLPQVTLTRLVEIKNETTTLSASIVPVVAQGFWRDIVDDGCGVSFHRLQVVLWTIVLGGVFIYMVAQKISMPEFPDTLLLLLSISNGTYLGFKFPEKT